MTGALCIFLFAWGHLYRDGYPATHSTHLARAIGGFMALAGAIGAIGPAWGAAVGLAIWIGFYVDQKHGEGQNATGWRDVGFLALSGVTSLLLAAAVLALRDVLAYRDPWGGLFVLLGLVKPGIWFFWWRVRPDRLWSWLEPTRVAAINFGAFAGWGVALCR
jgi:hypothetical protein